jgi:protein-disulfide isomerase-like protein with CxxC motif
MTENRHPVPTPRPAAEATTRWARLTETVRSHRAERAAEAQLRRELAAYDTPAAIADLLAAAERYDGTEAEVVKQILSANLAEVGRRRTAHLFTAH